MDSIDSLIKPLRPQLKDLIKKLPKPVLEFSESLLGKKCHKSLVLNIDLSSKNAECVQLGISKALGVGIVGAASFIKVPQLIKLLQSQSAEGLSFTSYLLETTAFVITLAYNLRHGFPFSTYGEILFIAIQDIVITTLVLIFSDEIVGSAMFLGALATGAYALFVPDAGMVDSELLTKLQAAAGVMGVLSKVPQILQIWLDGSTGQLSAVAVFGYLLGSLSRIFTTLQEVNDPLILYGFIAGAVLNCVLAAQFVYYWNVPPVGDRNRVEFKGELDAGEEHLDDGVPTYAQVAAPSPAGSTRSKAPVTKRRG